jgi:hypothetical protein
MVVAVLQIVSRFFCYNKKNIVSCLQTLHKQLLIQSPFVFKLKFAMFTSGPDSLTYCLFLIVFSDVFDSLCLRTSL